MVQKTTFIQKLYKILEDEDYQQLIRWSSLGTSFLVMDSAEFSRNVLPKVFKHNNYTSFVRQLNLYGFHKTNRSYHRHAGMTDAEREAEPREFSHPKFIRYRPDLLGEIRRKSAQDRLLSTSQISGFPSAADELHAATTLAGVASASRPIAPAPPSVALMSERNAQPHHHQRKGSPPLSTVGASPHSPMSPVDRSPHYSSLPPPGVYSHPPPYPLPPTQPIVGTSAAASRMEQGGSTLTMMQDVQSMIMKQLSHLQTNVQDLMAELRDVRKTQDMQQRVIESLLRDGKMSNSDRDADKGPRSVPSSSSHPPPPSHHLPHHHRQHPLDLRTDMSRAAEEHYYQQQQQQQQREHSSKTRDRSPRGSIVAPPSASPLSNAASTPARHVTAVHVDPLWRHHLLRHCPMPRAHHRKRSFRLPLSLHPFPLCDGAVALDSTSNSKTSDVPVTTSPYASPPVDTHRNSIDSDVESERHVRDRDRERSLHGDRYHPYAKEDDKPRFILPPPRGQEEWGRRGLVGWR
ncbi:uncharacterized protein SPPG_05445 [Spizellomyces punctatus DAOM BR117]|uniref:HSF-type DNA-binding domain-containing protein n=1 Tax=Spizellomyces punctatus (strain DAOM BR117) TaxID=645134 RepID=A0A0L0HDY9_SPIPD|nr:uncharacterized protein SPPG_05445 [Spizellomyces punctatus DAOM BR117]KNC99189.1 hypothetical protein SPPG_05445 [Spizellomyces punctatus DAOM BR117]|eukprot:XP_016607229.1 hypothetical protein SPPG_05445 [Spizellomyces punctatus DAOM BR117]